MSVHILCGLFLSGAAAVTDVKRKKIPGNLILIGLALGGGLWLGKWGLKGLLTWLAGTGALLGVSLLLYYLGAFGAGDVKLLSVLGGVLGLRRGFLVFVLSLLLAAAGGILYMFRQGELRSCLGRCRSYVQGLFLQKGRRCQSDDMLRICYGAAVFAAMLLLAGGEWLWIR